MAVIDSGSASQNISSNIIVVALNSRTPKNRIRKQEFTYLANVAKLQRREYFCMRPLGCRKSMLGSSRQYVTFIRHHLIAPKIAVVEAQC
jgi:hypothetical protein